MGYLAGKTIATGTTLDQYRSVAGRATIEIANTTFATNSELVSANSSVWKKVGALDGVISITPNHDVVKLQSSALQNPYAVIDTAFDYQVTFTLQEVDLHNYALALGFKEAAVTADSPGGQKILLNASQSAGYRAMRITSLGANTSAAIAYQMFVFYKVRIQASGSFDLDRTAAINIPVTAHCLGSSSDEVGAMYSSVAPASRAYG
jgi:hypothetical protein